jgi:hypothetical protein
LGYKLEKKVPAITLDSTTFSQSLCQRKKKKKDLFRGRWVKKPEFGSEKKSIMSVFLDFFVCKSQKKQSLLFLQLVFQGHNDYIGALHLWYIKD